MEVTTQAVFLCSVPSRFACNGKEEEGSLSSKSAPLILKMDSGSCEGHVRVEAVVT